MITQWLFRFAITGGVFVACHACSAVPGEPKPDDASRSHPETIARAPHPRRQAETKCAINARADFRLSGASVIAVLAKECRLLAALRTQVHAGLLRANDTAAPFALSKIPAAA
jgi:hypothetical protein